MSLAAAMSAMDISAKPKKARPDKTGLLDLPAEVWSKIGKMVIDDCPLLTTDSITGPRRAFPLQPAITRTDRALREELLPYYYKSQAQIHITAFDQHGLSDFLLCEVVGQWLRTIGAENRKQLGSVRLSCSEWRSTPFDEEEVEVEKERMFVYLDGEEEDWTFGRAVEFLGGAFRTTNNITCFVTEWRVVLLG